MVADGLTKAVEEFFAHLNPTAALKQAGRGFCYQEATGVGQKMKAIALLSQRRWLRQRQRRTPDWICDKC
ncbi:hypothetical protein GXM_08614 [Nostoc sphaeroides CCNUC1]|uniref:Uncharacterized protein n=1 Tax=Nostoc sphaeroides CCNUC1 TaxID=2653204 RepID=A0A5P8WEV2_9NOSO|nr:hypothetical protein GXM_08614 [Nostoc sphaeroides CCNUC1]